MLSEKQLKSDKLIAELESDLADARGTIKRLGIVKEELEAILRTLVAHDVAMSGPHAHRHGCDCGASPDGLLSCESFRAAFIRAKASISTERALGIGLKT